MMPQHRRGTGRCHAGHLSLSSLGHVGPRTQSLTQLSIDCSYNTTLFPSLTPSFTGFTPDLAGSTPGCACRSNKQWLLVELRTCSYMYCR